jgi:hypothetical protein
MRIDWRKQAKSNLSRIDPLVGLVEDNVGGLIESPERTLQQQDELTSHKHHMARQQETGGALLTTMLRPSLVMTEMTSAEAGGGEHQTEE